VRAELATTARAACDVADATVTEAHVRSLFASCGTVLFPPPRLGRESIGRVRQRLDPSAVYAVVRAACCARRDGLPDDALTLSRLLHGLSALCRPQSEEEAPRYVLAAFDADADGALDEGELAALLAEAYAGCATRGIDTRMPAELSAYCRALAAALAPPPDGAAREPAAAAPPAPPVGPRGVRTLLAAEPSLRAWLPVSVIAAAAAGDSPERGSEAGGDPEVERVEAVVAEWLA